MPNDESPLKTDNPVVAIVGANGGLGSAMARELAQRGARLLLTARTEEAVRDLQTELPETAVAILDIRDPEAGDRLVDVATSHFGRLDVLVNAAGIVAFGNLADTPDLVIEELFLTNVIGPLWLLRRCLPLLQASKGTVVQLSAVVAEHPMPGMATYAATKAALTAADTALTRELRRSGVRVLDVRPPHTETGLADRPLHGTAPRLPTGLAPEAVARAIADAIDDPRRNELASNEFTEQASMQRGTPTSPPDCSPNP